ncbi:hypothetical protein, partial [Pseudomonas syringae]|uniref:hypothetical protein n=1 Tax=Pseudomonas syringae TaxID=317 RepID=UPI001E33CAA6
MASLQQGWRRINAEIEWILVQECQTSEIGRGNDQTDDKSFRSKQSPSRLNLVRLMAQKKGKKKRPVKVAFFRFKEFKGLEAMYGAADGTRTRDPRRDRPV